MFCLLLRRVELIMEKRKYEARFFLGFTFCLLSFKWFYYSFSIMSSPMTDLNIVCQNCRGISTRDISTQAFRFIHKYKLTMICLTETRANEDQFNRFVTGCQPLGAGLKFQHKVFQEGFWSPGENTLDKFHLQLSLSVLSIWLFLQVLLFLFFITLLIFILNVLCGMSSLESLLLIFLGLLLAILMLSLLEMNIKGGTFSY